MGVVEVLDPVAPARAGGWKVDVSRGERNGRVSSEWFNRPDDERYLSLDDLWAKYKEEYKLDDFPPAIMEAVSYDGHLYSMPVLTNTELFFYRKDLFDEAGIAAPKTMDDYQNAAAKLDSGRMSGTIMSLKPVDAALNETHWYLNAVGDGWFDENWRPFFNQEAGVKAITRMKEMSEFAPRGFTSHANDESTINLQQGLAAMGLQWFTRAASMDDPQKSRVVGKIDWVAPPGGGARVANDGFAISAFSSGDKEEMFRMLAEASSVDSMIKGAEFSMPPRLSVLQNEELSEKYRWYPAARAALEDGKPFPALPDFNDVGDIVTRHVLRAVTGEVEVKAALETVLGQIERLGFAGVGFATPNGHLFVQTSGKADQSRLGRAVTRRSHRARQTAYRRHIDHGPAVFLELAVSLAHEEHRAIQGNLKVLMPGPGAVIRQHTGHHQHRIIHHNIDATEGR